MSNPYSPPRHQVPSELNSLWLHLMSEREDLEALKEKLTKAERRIQQLSDEIKAQCKESAAERACAVSTVCNG